MTQLSMACVSRCARLSMPAWYGSAVPRERATSCGGHGLEKEVAICVNVCACHAFFVSYDVDDWRSRVFRRWTARLEHCHPASLRLTLSTSKRRLNASFCHVIILTFSHPLSRDFFAVSFVKCS